MSGVQYLGIVLILLLGVWGLILFQNILFQRSSLGVQILGQRSGVMNQCWVFGDLPIEDNLFFCYALT